MTAYEFLATHRLAFEQVEQLSIKTSDVKYIDLYRDYTRLVKEGHKKTYIIQYLSDEYGVDERTTYRVIQRMSASVEI